MQMTRGDQALHGIRNSRTLKSASADTGLRLPCLRCGRFGFTAATLNKHYGRSC